MNVIPVSDINTQRRAERAEADMANTNGLIEYIACMANIDLPEDDTASENGPEVSEDEAQ